MNVPPRGVPKAGRPDEDFVPTEYDRTGDPKISGIPGVAGPESDLDNGAIRDIEENEDERAVKRDMTNTAARPIIQRRLMTRI
ncbi:hypothetical protein [Phyllobacterium bourgognense]|uniref:Uncharacterized protein n=1 Tax=Phyllobacterium bourgognense TaxID=314236 RepID=A0A368YF52_9HYPH|nr:hypothetical protein [Phyllobacterium bourgognense]RCW78873.1 hypothetical protein C7476_12159 [Phyllobacterium bourgognense]